MSKFKALRTHLKIDDSSAVVINAHGLFEVGDSQYEVLTLKEKRAQLQRDVLRGVMAISPERYADFLAYLDRLDLESKGLRIDEEVYFVSQILDINQWLANREEPDFS